MNKYKVGDKVVMEITGVSKYGECYEVAHTSMWNTIRTERVTEPLSTYTEPLEAKIRRQAAEITRLLAENKELKEDFEKSKKVNLNMGRLAGQNEAWELARKIYLSEEEGGYSGAKLFEIFDKISIGNIYRLTYSEAAAKVAEWEKAKEEIKVGDIFQDNDGNNAIVTSIKGNTVYYMWDDGDTRSGFAEDVKKHFTKTGRHIDIDGFLKQIGGEQE